MGAPFIDIVFAPVEGTPDLTFVEVESPPGQGVKVGQWIKRDDGLLALRLTGRIDDLPFAITEDRHGRPAE